MIKKFKKKKDLKIKYPSYVYVIKKIKYPRITAIVTHDYGNVFVDVDKNGKVVGVEFLEDIIISGECL